MGRDLRSQLDGTPATDQDVWLGQQIRARRVRLGFALREFARLCELSPSFVSQLERGLTRPSINTLHRMARELGTTAQALLSSGEARRYSLVRRDDAVEVPHGDSAVMRSVVRGDRRLTAMECQGTVSTFGLYYEHPGEELYLVISGEVEVDLDGELIRLGPGDSLCYDGRTPHRSRQFGEEEVLMYIITSRDDIVQPD